MPIDVHQVDIVIAAGTLFALKEELDRIRGQHKALQAENTRLCLELQRLALEKGFMSINKCRALEGLNPLPTSDEIPSGSQSEFRDPNSAIK